MSPIALTQTLSADIVAGK